MSTCGHQDPRRRPLIDLAHGDYSDVKKHLQDVYLRCPQQAHKLHEQHLLKQQKNANCDKRNSQNEVSLPTYKTAMPEEVPHRASTIYKVQQESLSTQSTHTIFRDEHPSHSANVMPAETASSQVSFERALYQHHLLVRQYHNSIRDSDDGGNAVSSSPGGNKSVETPGAAPKSKRCLQLTGIGSCTDTASVQPVSSGRFTCLL